MKNYGFWHMKLEYKHLFGNTSICLGIQTNYGTNPDTGLHTGVVTPCWVTADNIIELCMNSVYMYGLHIAIGPKVCSGKIEPIAPMRW